MLAQLKFASLPAPLGLVAVHFWFTVGGDRWEVWQRRNAGGTSFGHLHRNLKAPEEGVGGGPARLACEWPGAAGIRIRNVLEESALCYPFRQRYLPWPGPNSNTFVAWVLRRAGIDYRLPWKAIGRNFACPAA
jgi:hypothetical protein